ncbi:hypothetical protein AQUCO_03800054v1 [Aquilegia coerulea]|uniref:Bromo domain-containing protein n=1 Tax=Aquilegia coerulea TaxID=218851 RepID=A0A2G5CSC7_AQUCA|nr:hypothetical protein AQUCO_03800054v1 [Aquilegia coerulea]
MLFSTCTGILKIKRSIDWRIAPNRITKSLSIELRDCLETCFEVGELRREVQQYDVSIVSLQLKVKRLTEERERSSKDNQVQPSDLDRTVPEKTISGEDSDRDNQSFNESNSTDLKNENQVTAGVDESDKTQPNKIVACAGAGELDPFPNKQGRSRKFFRDLLVLLNNAIVYFRNNSVEFTAATELRQIVSKEMGLRIQKVDQSPETQELAPPIIPPPALPKLDLEPSDSLLMKQKSSVPMIACRKRSSIIYKAAPERKVEKKEAVVEDKKPAFDRKKQDSLVTLAEEKNVIKKEKRDRPASGTRSSRTVSKSSNRNPSPSSNQASSSKGGTAAEDNSETKAEKEKNNNSTVSKKRSVANFLNRMKKNTSSNGTLLDSLKNSGNSSNNSKGGNAEQKKSSGGRGDVRKEQATRQSVSRRQTRDQSSPAKRSVGRPPKRNASSPITPPVSSKRSRETTETEAAASRQPRKRSRR